MELSSLSLESIPLFQFIVLIFPTSQVWGDQPIFHPWLWIDAKNRLCCCETSPNTRLKHPYDAVLFHFEQARHLSCAQHSYVKIFSQYTMYSTFWISYHVCFLARLLVYGHPITFCGFSSPFLSSSFGSWIIWLITARFVLTARTTSFKLCHPILYCFNSRSGTFRTTLVYFILVTAVHTCSIYMYIKFYTDFSNSVT